MDSNEHAVRKKLNDVSPSFCLAKWYQVTIHLQTGQTHSCHHPHPHKVDVRELQENSTALHNTVWKKYQRYKMLKGERPAECDYCWKIEDSHIDNISDRTLKSAEDWALPNFEEATTKPWDFDFTPRYVEVSFGHACNFKCIYCAPHISSSIMAEFQRFGHYKESPEFALDNLARTGQMPIPKEDWNPYVDAFWKWWPELVPELKNFRITGGEPLINQNTFRFLEYIKEHPMPELIFGINSNLGIPDAQYDRFLESMKYILDNKLIRQFEFFTSVDTHGVQAEYIRNGLSYKNYMTNVRKFLTTLPIDTKLVFMCTYNALSVPTFNDFLEDVVALKKEFKNSQGFPRVVLDMPYLRDPSYLSLAVLTEDFESMVKESLIFMKDRTWQSIGDNWTFTEHEVSKMERVYKWFVSLPKDGENVRKMRANFYSFLQEHDRRRGLNFKNCFPMMRDFHQICEDIYKNDTIDLG